MRVETQFAEQQLLGFLHAKRGYGIIALIVSMGLTKKEWIEINNNTTLSITEEEKAEINDHFSKKVVS